MKLFFRIACLVLLLSATRAQDFGFDLADALDDGTAPKPTLPPKKDDDFGLDLSDALGGDDDPYPAKPPVVDTPQNPSGGGGSLDDKDLFNLGGGGGGGDGGNYQPDGGHYKPDAGHYNPDDDYRGGGGRGQDPRYHHNGGADQAQEAGSGKIAGIVGAIGVAIAGAASSYFAYQKKKLCFKLQGGQDPEHGNRHNNQSQPQFMSNLLQA